MVLVRDLERKCELIVVKLAKYRRHNKLDRMETNQVWLSAGSDLAGSDCEKER